MALTDKDGNVAARYEYDAWGLVTRMYNRYGERVREGIGWIGDLGSGNGSPGSLQGPEDDSGNIDPDYHPGIGNAPADSLTTDSVSAEALVLDAELTEAATVVEPTEDITTDLVKENPIRYAGYYWDRKSQYYYLQARYYDPRPARFISEDTYEGEIEQPQSLNMYVYVKNNPLTYLDPTGHNPLLACAIPVVGQTACATAANVIVQGIGLAAVWMWGRSTSPPKEAPKVYTKPKLEVIPGGKGNSNNKSKEKAKEVPFPYGNNDKTRSEGYIYLYHGTSREDSKKIFMNGIDLRRQRPKTDFGQGFYVTKDIKQAARWATKDGAIVIFKVRPAELKSFFGRTFLWADKSWESFVKMNRKGKGTNHPYDYVEGPMLGNLGWLEGKGPHMAWGNQISIHTPRMAAWLYRHIVPAMVLPQSFLK